MQRRTHTYKHRRMSRLTYVTNDNFTFIFIPQKQSLIAALPALKYAAVRYEKPLNRNLEFLWKAILFESVRN